MAGKQIKAKVKLQLPAGEATPAPPLGPALAPHGVQLGDFCGQFNDRTRDQKGWIIPVDMTIYEDRTFEFKTKTPPVSQFLKKAAGIETGSGNPLQRKVGSITKDQLKEIAEKKLEDLSTSDVEKAMKIVEGSAKAMGIEIK